MSIKSSINNVSNILVFFIIIIIITKIECWPVFKQDPKSPPWHHHMLLCGEIHCPTYELYWESLEWARQELATTVTREASSVS